MKVLFASNEVAPFAKVGGLADVAGTFPIALAELGVDARVAMPLHRVCLKHGPFREVVASMPVTLAGRTHPTSVVEGKLPGSQVPIYFIKYDPYFDRAEIYGEGGRDYPDAAERYAFLSQALLALPQAVGFAADVIHANDWMTGLLPLFAQARQPVPPTLYTIHNLGYQGEFPPTKAADVGLTAATAIEAAHNSRVNFMAAGIRTATLVSTVSERYAQEIQTEEYGCGLERLLQARSQQLYGVVNGIDYSVWNPATDPALPATYSAENLGPKAKCKAAIQAEFGLTVKSDVPLLGCVSRITAQKGLDVLAEALPQALSLPLQFALLGTGEPALEKAYGRLAAQYPGSIAVITRFDEALSRRVYAGSDLFAMPSRYEPCGLGQMIAMAYGTPPLARWTGGLADTIVEHDARQNGFLFGELSAPHLLGALQRATAAYHDPSRWAAIVANALAADFSWAASARRYVEIYKTAIAAPAS